VPSIDQDMLEKGSVQQAGDSVKRGDCPSEKKVPQAAGAHEKAAKKQECGWQCGCNAVGIMARRGR